MKWKVYIRRTKGVLILLSLIGVMLWMLLMGYLIVGALASEEILKDAVTMNRIALFLGLSSIPGFLTTFVSLAEMNEKKSFTLEQKCPKCNHLVDFKLTED